MAVKTHSTYTVYKRIANLILILIGIAISVNLWWVNKQQTQLWYTTQAQQLGRSLTEQKAMDLIAPVTSDDTAAIERALAQVLTDKHVVAGAVYDFRGRRLASQGLDGDFLTSLQTQRDERLVFVADIIRTQPATASDGEERMIQQQVVGYVKLQLSANAVMAHHDKFQQQLAQQLLVFMLLAALGALYVTRAFYKLRFRMQRRLRAKQRLMKQS
ncbi:hypothetical protein QTP81_03985 [Alteromonas sp. ASW11-36]|uniref:Smp protein n=1 Tax=Alteromonas arenosi TaxID=3055817 RepID=A0ABT7SU91_9ALTE|nr:hypothetical protein [Alteromonas sp. ASW11-36]MDM7859764.1 hypothetical protein [Alteromonas sp. ASW11-36]